jgi:ribosomal protein L37AE/L43A
MTESKCFYCGWDSEKVEAQGIWYCPNSKCSGSGAAWFRRGLKSYKEVKNCHTVNRTEYFIKSTIYMSMQRIRKCIGLKHSL